MSAGKSCKDAFNWSLAQASACFLRAFLADWGVEHILRAVLKSRGIVQNAFDSAGQKTTFLTIGPMEAQPVFFLHGTPGSALSWWPYLNNPGNFRMIAVDRPGFSPINRVFPDPVGDMEILALLLRKTAETRPAIVVGHSMGGGLAAKLAADCPQHVKNLVLIGASLDPSLEQVKPVQYAARKAPLKFLMTRTTRNSNEELINYPDLLRDLQPDLKKIHCPVLIVHARDDGLVPYENVKFIKEQFTGTRSISEILYDSGGHAVNASKYKDILAALEG